MTSRRNMLAVLGSALAASAQAEQNHAETLHRQPLPPPFEGWVAEFASVTMVPGPGFAPHRHNGFVLGYGVEGEPERVLHAGETFYEPPAAHHTVSASADLRKNARILAIIISKEVKN